MAVNLKFPHPTIHIIIIYLGVHTNDNCVGEMRDMLQEKGLAENTIFIYCSDNGAPRSYAGGV